MASLDPWEMKASVQFSSVQFSRFHFESLQTCLTIREGQEVTRTVPPETWKPMASFTSRPINSSCLTCSVWELSNSPVSVQQKKGREASGFSKDNLVAMWEMGWRRLEDWKGNHFKGLCQDETQNSGKIKYPKIFINYGSHVKTDKQEQGREFPAI